MKSRYTIKILKFAVIAFIALLSAVNISGVFMSDTGVAFAEVPKIELIAKFSTYYGDSKPNRKENVALAARKIDGLTLYPEEEFSFNGVVGKRSAANGFKSAYIIQDGEFVEGIGGGVCQVSSTIYNCALLADLAITSVYPHSLPVAYVAPSFDAMVSSVSDLCFVNTLSAPVTFKMKTDGKTVTAEIYGVPQATIRRRSETTATIPYPTSYVEDASMPQGEEKIDTYGKNGLKSLGFLDYFEDGKIVKSVQIRKDTYQPQKQVIFRGVKTVI